MREYKDTLIDKGINVHYNKLETLEVSKSYFENFGAFLKEHSFDKINIYEIEDKLFEEESINYFKEDWERNRIYQVTYVSLFKRGIKRISRR
tara:strand:- start:220 stop:495 length:276 start_codon:yes stop_codon:yes gene_type:complete